jgi:hypothetical protein
MIYRLIALFSTFAEIASETRKLQASLDRSHGWMPE